jgi:DUF1365 family protein
MTIKSALFVGDIEHRRLSPKTNSFTYRVCYYFLDLKKIPSLFNIPFVFSYNKPGLLSFWRKDYLGNSSESIEASVQRLVFEHTQKEVKGPIFLLANISYFGLCFNPVSFYYCYGEDGETLEFIVSEITNTPWGEKHRQVFEVGDKKINTFEFPKDFHVSPFMPMTIDYTWVFHKPSDELYVYMQNRNKGEKRVIFDSTLKLTSLPMTSRNIILAFAQFPFVTFKTMFAIYYQALVLFIKRVPFHTHPLKEKFHDNSSST